MERKNYRRNDYIMGNTARQLEPAVQDRPQIRNTRVSERKKMKSALAINGVSVLLMAIVAAFCIAICVGYLYLQSNISETRNNISKIKTDINTVQSQNDALKYSINTYVDSENVYKVATKKLGMRQAKGDQLSIYKTSNKGYTVQYGDIPNK